MPPETLNSFFTPVSTETNPHQQIDDLILMSELDKIAREDMMYGAMTQFNPEDWTHGTGGLGLLEWADTGPIVGMKALAGLVGKGGKTKAFSKINKIAKDMFGTTDNVGEAGYILHDGSMLDFSGRGNVKALNPEAIEPGVRGLPHTKIYDVGDWLKGGSDDFNKVRTETDFMELSKGIRWMPDMNMVHMTSRPSSSQLAALKNVYKKVDNYSGLFNDFKVYLNKSTNPRLWLDELEFKAGTPWEDIQNEILRYYDVGKESEVARTIRQFRELGKGG